MQAIIVLEIVGMMMLYLLSGFCLVKSKLGDSSHARSLSGLLVYICGPCMVINAFLTMDHQESNMSKIWLFFLVSLLVQIAFFSILYFVLTKKMDQPQYRVLTMASVLGNVGFYGLPLVTSLFPNEPVVAGYSSIFVMSMNLIIFTAAVYMLTGDKKYMSIRSCLVNPTSIALYIAVPAYYLNIKLPDALGNGIGLMGKMTTPLCMIVLGMRLASMDLKKLFTQSFAYMTCLCKLILFPLFAYAVVYFMPWFDNTFKVSLFVLSAAPTGAIVLSMAEIHKCDQELAANAVLLTTLLSIITAPILMLLVL